jgi:hypothetical protein
LIFANLKSTKNPMKSTYFQILISISRRFNLIFDHWFTQFDFQIHQNQFQVLQISSF